MSFILENLLLFPNSEVRLAEVFLIRIAAPPNITLPAAAAILGAVPDTLLTAAFPKEIAAVIIAASRAFEIPLLLLIVLLLLVLLVLLVLLLLTLELEESELLLLIVSEELFVSKLGLLEKLILLDIFFNFF